MLIGNQFGQVRYTCHCLRKSNNSSVFSGKNAGKFSMDNALPKLNNVVVSDHIKQKQDCTDTKDSKLY